MKDLQFFHVLQELAIVAALKRKGVLPKSKI